MNHNEPTSPTPQEGCTYSTDESTSSDHQPLTAPSSEASVVGQNSLDVLKGFKVSLGDSTMKVLPAALKKYKINENDWQKYVIFICYGSPGNRIERCLNYDEKPLLLFQTLKNANKNPVFMLKHTKDIRSPIAISRAKYATRRACTVPTPSSSGCQLGGDSKDDWDFVCAPAELDVATQDSANDAKSRGASTPEGGSSQSNRIQMTTYAVAIYPYMAEKDDEFDVVVGDTFVILSKDRSWWVVVKDPAGSGGVDTSASKSGCVPAGCMLEMNVPLASAIANACTDTSSVSEHRKPILPLNIMSSCVPGIASMDYQQTGEEELDLAKGEAVRICKLHSHWYYVVKEECGNRGWVPSWYIGKAQISTALLPAQCTTSAPTEGGGATPGAREQQSLIFSSEDFLGHQSAPESPKEFNVGWEDPTWMVLPAALKKHRVTDYKNWKDYVIFISHGSPDHRIERCLNYDEKPLLLFQQLKDEKKNPVFVVKHRRHLPSPVAVALKGQTKRKAHVIPKDTTTDSEQGEDIRDSVSTSATLVDDARSSAKSAKTRTTNMSSSLLAHTIKKKSCYGAVVSYAIAVYPYAAEQQDEFDISLGDTFVVIFQARNWWVVQRDRIGSGLVDIDTTKQGLAPSGCLLETTVPVASAIAEARTTALSTSSNAPILPKSIISPSCTGNVTTDHKKMGEEEVDVASGDIVRVFRRYDHWSYVVKEDGDRGWVPSWHINEVTGSAATAPLVSSPATGHSHSEPLVQVRKHGLRHYGRICSHYTPLLYLALAFALAIPLVWLIFTLSKTS